METHPESSSSFEMSSLLWTHLDRHEDMIKTSFSVPVQLLSADRVFQLQLYPTYRTYRFMAAITCHTLTHSFSFFTGSCLRLTLYVCTLHAVDVDPLQGRMHVEQVGYKGQVEFAVSRCDVMRRDKLSAVQPGRLLQHQLGPVVQIVLLHVHMKQTYM